MADLLKIQSIIPAEVFSNLQSCFDRFAINNELRIAHFLAQVIHESGSFKYLSENLNYSADGLRKIFPKYFPGNTAEAYARQPVKIASRVYANRMGNGNEASQDGYTFRGRGYIQLTGKNNYTAFGQSLGEDIVSHPDLVATPKYGLLSAGWFWSQNKLNAIADTGAVKEVVAAITKRVNGGTIGLDDRWNHFQQVYGLLMGTTNVTPVA
jgi:putative chitinase